MNRVWRVFLLAAFGIVLVAGHASANEYGFINITNNNATNAAVGEAQLKMDVTQQGSNISFLFTNSGPYASSITDIYFDDDVPLLTFQGFTASTGVNFSVGATPLNLPGGQAYHFTSNYSYDSQSPTQPNGINPGESLQITFGTTSNFNGIISAIDNSSLQIGIHVQGFSNGGSESFINDPPVTTNSVPEPSILLCLIFGISGLMFIRRFKTARISLNLF